MASREADIEINLPTEEEYLGQFWCHLDDKDTMNMNQNLDSVLRVDGQLRDLVLNAHGEMLKGKEFKLISLPIRRTAEYDEIKVYYPGDVILSVDGRTVELDEFKVIVEREGKFRLMRVAP